MAEIRWTKESTQWLQDIFEYISVDNPVAAEKVISSIFEKVQVLIEYPEIGHNYQTVSGRNVRILLYGHYRITYLIKESGNIDILGIFHGSLDIDRYLI
jgi:plasmid stabilization system protein ParE